MKKYFTKEMTIGLITIISLIILYFGINYLKGVNLLKPSNHYYVKFSNVTELQNSSPVYVDGFKVGVVNNINYDFKNPGNIVVLISLDKSMKIQTGSYVNLSVGLTTGASLNIMLNEHVTSYCSVGDTIEGKVKAGLMDMVSQELLPQIQTIMPRIDTILTGLQTIVNHPALTQSLDHIEKTSSNLSMTTTKLNSMMNKDVPVILDNFKQVSSDFTIVSANLKSLEFQKTFDNVNSTLENVEKLTIQLNSKDNNLGLLLNDRQLYDNLNSTTENASTLLLDLRQNPKRYVHFSIF